MRFLKEEIVFQEVPDEVSLLFHITNCPHKCPECHSQSVNRPHLGKILTDELFEKIILQYRNMATCILFWGGEWEPDSLNSKLEIAQNYYFKTCLYTGLDDVPLNIRKNLTYLKTGRYISNLGALDSPTTNQRFIELKTGEVMNHYFQSVKNSYIYPQGVKDAHPIH